MKKLLALLLCAALCLPVLALAETTADTYTVDFEDFTLTLTEYDLIQRAPTKVSDELLAMVYVNYDESKTAQDNFNIVWCNYDGNSSLSFFPSVNEYGSALLDSNVKALKAAGFGVSNDMLLYAQAEGPIAAFMYTYDVDYSALGLDLILTQYQMQVTYTLSNDSSYIFTFTSGTMEGLEALTAYMDAIDFK